MENIDPTEYRRGNYMKEISKSLIKNREIQNLTLRKNKLDKIISEKRSNLSLSPEESYNYEISVDQLTIGRDVVENFMTAENCLDLAFDYLSDPDRNMRQFGMRQIRNYSDALDSKSEVAFSSANYDALLNIVAFSKDLKELYETSLTFINLTNCSTEVSKVIVEKGYHKQLFDNLLIENHVIKNHMLLIIGNILSDHQSLFDKVVKETSIIGFVVDTLLKASNPSFFKSTLIWATGQIAKRVDNDMIDTISPLIEYIIVQLKIPYSLSKEYFGASLETFNKLLIRFSEDEEMIPKYFSDTSYFRNIISNITIGGDLADVKTIFSILGSLSYASNDYVYDMVDSELFPQACNYLKSIVLANDISLLKKHKHNLTNFTWMLCNIASVDSNRIKSLLIRKTRIADLLIQLAGLGSNSDYLMNIVDFLINGLESNKKKVKTELLRERCLEFFCEHLKSKKIDVVKGCLNGINLMIEFGNEMMSGLNIIKEQVINIGVDSTISNLMSHTDDEVAQLAANLHGTYFNDQK